MDTKNDGPWKMWICGFKYGVILGIYMKFQRMKILTLELKVFWIFTPPYKESYSDFHMILWSVWCGKESVLYKMMTLLTLADPRNPNLMDHLWCYVRHQRTSKIFFSWRKGGWWFQIYGCWTKNRGKTQPPKWMVKKFHGLNPIF